MPFEKGKSGNPNGRPKKGQTFTDLLEKELRRRSHDTASGKISRKRAVVEKLIDLALDGDITALKYLMDRIDGKPRESHELSGPGGGPMQFARIERVIVDPDEPDTQD